MATGTTNAIPTYGEVTGYTSDLSKKTYPIYISSATTKYSYSSYWRGALVLGTYGRRIHGCISFRATNTFTFTSENMGNYDFVEFTLSYALPKGITAYAQNHTGTLFCLTNASTVSTNVGLSLSITNNETTITISPRYNGNNYSLTSGLDYTITW